MEMSRRSSALLLCAVLLGVLSQDSTAFISPTGIAGSRTLLTSDGRSSSSSSAFNKYPPTAHLKKELSAVEKKKQVPYNGAASAERGNNNKRQWLSRRRRRDRPHLRTIPKRAVHLYMDYAGRLWNETNPEARRRIANTKAATALRQVQHILRGDEYTQFADDSNVEARTQLLDACDDLLAAMGNETFLMMGNETLMMDQEAAQNGMPILSSQAAEEEEDVQALAATKNQTEATVAAAVASAMEQSTALVAQEEDSTSESSSEAAPKKKKKNRRSILFGATMGLCVAAWVFSGNYIFTGLFTLMTILGQLEYYRMVINTGVYPARRISVVGGCTMFLTALFVPDYHQICLPLFGLWTMIWFLTMRRKPGTIPEIATTFTGMFYLGYVPSFWVRIRQFGPFNEPTRLAPLAEPFLRFIQNKAESRLPSFVPSAVHLPITSGAIFIFWTWLCLAFSDVGAYFVGKFHGKTKLGTISPAAGATSPNKTVEGVLGGCAVSAGLGVLGAWVQKWPLWPLTGAIHGTLLALLGLLGDLTASMLKRDAGLKDFGDLLPEHGGVMDRVDSFIWSAPYSWLVCTTVIPALRQWVR